MLLQNFRPQSKLVTKITRVERPRFSVIDADQLQYALWLSEEAHKRGLAIGQKNAPDMVADLVDIYDVAITEDAFYYGLAGDMRPYIAANKPVFAAEYTDLPSDFQAFCCQSKALVFSAILKKTRPERLARNLRITPRFL